MVVRLLEVRPKSAGNGLLPHFIHGRHVMPPLTPHFNESGCRKLEIPQALRRYDTIRHRIQNGMLDLLADSVTATLGGLDVEIQMMTIKLCIGLLPARNQR